MSSTGNNRTRTRRTFNFTPSQLKSLKRDGKYRNRDINKLSDFNVSYDSIKEMEEWYRKNYPSMEQNKLAKKTASSLFKTMRPNNSVTRSRRNNLTRRNMRSRSRSRSRGNSNSSRTRINSSRIRISSSSGTRRNRSSPLSVGDL